MRGDTDPKLHPQYCSAGFGAIEMIRRSIATSVLLLATVTSSAARFLQSDPVGYKDDVDLYAYVGNDPTNLTDPSGRYICSGNGDNCATLRQTLSQAKDLIANGKLTNTERAKLSAAVNAFGDEDKDNGVHVQFTGNSNYGGNTHIANGVVTVTYGPGFHGSNPISHRIRMVVHEGTHIGQEKHSGHDPAVGREGYGAELEAYRNEGHAARAMHDPTTIKGEGGGALWGEGWSRSQEEGAAEDNAEYTEDYREGRTQDYWKGR